MYQCPVCKKENTGPVCTGCDFDISRDYEGFPTLAELPAGLPSRKGAQMQLSGMHRCGNCGGLLFYLSLANNSCICASCGTEAPVPGTEAAADISAPQGAATLAIAAGDHHTAALRADGTVISTGANFENQCNTSRWRNIIAISAAGAQTIGLRQDGTVVATGRNGVNQCRTKSWTDITAISAGESHTLGLKKDGTVVATGFQDERCSTSGWKDIIAISAGDFHSVGLRSNGTVVATGNNDYGQCNVASWTNIVSITAFFTYTIGIKQDGTFVSTSNHTAHRLSSHRDIASVTALGRSNIVLLKKDGTVHHTDSLSSFLYKEAQQDPSTWRDVVSIAAGKNHIVGLLRDGTVVAFGSNRYGQCDVSDWKLAGLKAAPKT